MQALATTLAAAEGSNPQNLSYLVALLAVVLSLIALFRISLIKQGPQQAPATSTPRPTAPPSSPTAASKSSEADSIPPEIIAVIAAAVAAATGHKPVRIVSIKPMSTSWERAGRQSVLTSHRIR